MRVNDRKSVLDPRVGGPEPVGAGDGAAPARGSEGGDRVSVSEAARELAILRVGVGDLGALDRARVAGLAARLARGDYSADLREVARRMLRELLGEAVG
jgi:anti-sigma28 factor (negative regulator of flagellin synthesis)